MTKPLSIKLVHTYSKLGDDFFQRVLPEKVTSPNLLLWNESLALQLGFSHLAPIFTSEEHQYLAQLFSGNELLAGSEPLALAYSGHQFGHFNPQLGDGRAHLLGEVLDNQAVLRDIQLKGSGQTPFSRRGDGKCALAPAIREYVMSEAMYALGVPTSRCLAVVSTGEKIYRETEKQGAVVTRVASSHLRVGTFQYFAARGDLTATEKLLDYAITRHFPDMNTLKSATTELRTLQFLEKVIDKQIILIVNWLRVGFIHGVMNTDNTAICGETIDFGPCAMLGVYHEEAVFSSIDEYGRYAFAKQARIMQWNMARLADCLLPLLLQSDEGNIASDVDAKEQQILAKVETIVNDYTHKFEQAYYTMYAAKLGLLEVTEEVKQCIEDLLAMMQAKALDYTLTFAELTQWLVDKLAGKEQAAAWKSHLGEWFEQWQRVLNNTTIPLKKSVDLMQKNNPVVIPRNHHVEEILRRCEQAFEESSEAVTFEKINGIVAEFLTVLQSPYQTLAATAKYQDAPEDDDKLYRTFCGT